MATLQRYAAFVELILRDIEHNHDADAMLVADQVLAFVLTDVACGTENEPAAI